MGNDYNCIEEAKSIVRNYIAGGNRFKHDDFSMCSPVYKSTTETIDAYLPLLDLSAVESALTVLSSGDHYLNLLERGITNISTFDTNLMTEPYALGFKIALVIASDYRTYIDLSTRIVCNEVSFDEEAALFEELIPIMEERYKKFWKNLWDYCYDIQKNSLNRITLLEAISRQDSAYASGSNLFLKNEESYQRTQERLKNASISFTCCDVVDLSNYFKNQFGVILLSNLPDYFCHKYGYEWGYNILKEFEEMILGLLTQDGVACLAYIERFYNDPVWRRPIIRNSNICSLEIKGNNEEIIPFTGRRYDGMGPSNSAMLLLRKKGIGNNR